MKKNVLTKSLSISVILTVFCLGGCLPGKQSIADNQLPSECQIYDNKLIITLNENPTTGYRWEFQMDKNDIIEFESDEFNGDENPLGLDGVGGKHFWVFKGVSTGIVALTFKYRRPWEEANNVIETKSFLISVGKNGKIENVKQN